MFSELSSHRQAAELREAGKSEEALVLYQKVLLEYLAQKNIEGVIRVLLEKWLTYKHLWQETQNDLYLSLGSAEVQHADYLTYAYDVSPELHVLTQRNLGDYLTLREDYQGAEEELRSALEKVAGDDVSRADLLGHLAPVVWKTEGSAAAEQLFSEAMTLLQLQPEAPSHFVNQVWQSGVYLRWAQCLLDNQNQSGAREKIQLAEEIISGNPELIIRQKQLSTLKQQLHD